MHMLESKSEHPDVESVPRVGINAESIEAIAEMAIRLRHYNNVLSTQANWHNDICPSYSSPLLHNTVHAREDAKASECVMVVRDVLRTIQDEASGIWYWVSGQIDACEAHISSLKLRSGFSSLPDEVLLDVLEFVALEHTTADGVIAAATMLSHVCSRFRVLVVSSVHLWNRISPSMHSEAISTCFDRCGATGIQIVINTRNCAGLATFIPAAIEKSHLWRKFAHNCTSMTSSLADFIRHLNSVGEWRLQAPNVISPQLSRLVVRYPSFALYQNESIQDFVHFYSTWSTPRLHTMETNNFIPVAFSGSNTIVSLSVTLNFRAHTQGEAPLDVMAVASFLSSCQVLQDFSFKLRKCKQFIDPPSHHERAEMASVANLDLCFINCRSVVAKSLLSVIRFPNVRRMRLKCHARQIGVQKIVHEVLPTGNVFSKLRHLQLDVRASETYQPNDPVSIPFSSLPDLCILEFSTWNTVLEPLPAETIFPRLLEASFIDCMNLDLDWISTFCDRIASHWDPEAPLKVTVRGCPWELM